MILMLSDAEVNQPFIPIKETNDSQEETTNQCMPGNDQRSSLNVSDVLESKPKKTTKLQKSDK